MKILEKKKQDHNKKWSIYSIKFLFASILLILMVIYVRTFFAVVKKVNNSNSNGIRDSRSDTLNRFRDTTKNDISQGKNGNLVEGTNANTMTSANDANKYNDHSDEKEIQIAHEQDLMQQVKDHEETQQKQMDDFDDKKENPNGISTNQSNTNTLNIPIMNIPIEQRPKLTAYIEKIDQTSWSIKPLPTRQTTSSTLQSITYDKVNSCTKLPEQFPIDENVAPTNKDPFLPWIHDVFPTADGKFIQFVAQNKRRCQTGTRKTDVKKFFQPNVALFQHVPIKRLHSDSSTKNDTSTTRYQLTSHEDADPDGIETRFICRFKPTMEETLSIFNFNYDFHTLRKQYKATFTEEGFDNHMIWSSQLLFKCPVPKSLQGMIRLGQSVIDDYATLFVDLIPIRTPPRYGDPTTYLPPRLYAERNTWDVQKEWGDNHILPSIIDSGRWENIPICKPSLMTYPDEYDSQVKLSMTKDEQRIHDDEMVKYALETDNDIGRNLSNYNTQKKKHELISCTWTSAAFQTRGGRTHVNDGQERLKQWLEFNKLVGVDHVYIYDNSGALSKDTDLKPITDLFPGYVTRVNWPAKVCNNNRGNADNKGERSSQYAADASCRLRFGAHSTWFASHGK